MVAVVGHPVAEAGTVAGTTMVAAELHLHRTDVLGYSEGGMGYGCWSCGCRRNRSGPDDC